MRERSHFKDVPRKRFVSAWPLVRALAFLVLLLAPTATALSLDLPLAPDAEPPRVAPAPLAAPAAQDAQYRIVMKCPEVAPGTGVPVACPTYVLDTEDVLGSPRLVVDPRDGSRVAFSALHGGTGAHPVPGSEPPSARSRDDRVHQPHTTFASRDGGAGWTDMPYHAPDSMREASPEIFGDDNAIAVDPAGRLYIAALYSYRDGVAPTPLGEGAPFQHAVGTWKARGIERPVEYDVNLRILRPASPGARVDSLQLVFVPDANVAVLLWRETTAEGASSVVAHWTRPEDGALWTRVDPNATRAASCAAISNPLVVATRVVFACHPEAAGPWTTFGLDASTWTLAQLGSAPVEGSSAVLVERGRGGYMMLIASGVTEAATPIVQVAYGENGAAWSSAEDLADDLSRGDAGTPMLDARVTAAAYNPVSGNIHLVYMERYDLGQGGEQGAGRPEFYKTFAAIQAEGAFQAKVDLGVGSVNRGAFSPTLTGVGNGAFDDLHDGLVVWTDPATGRTREFLAYGDYGWVRFAEVTEENFLSPIAPLGAQTPPIPAASAGSVPALVGIPAGLLAGSMVARTMMARRKVTAEAPAE